MFFRSAIHNSTALLSQSAKRNYAVFPNLSVRNAQCRNCGYFRYGPLWMSHFVLQDQGRQKGMLYTVWGVTTMIQRQQKVHTIDTLCTIYRYSFLDASTNLPENCKSTPLARPTPPPPTGQDALSLSLSLVTLTLILILYMRKVLRFCLETC